MKKLLKLQPKMNNLKKTNEKLNENQNLLQSESSSVLNDLKTENKKLQETISALQEDIKKEKNQHSEQTDQLIQKNQEDIDVLKKIN